MSPTPGGKWSPAKKRSWRGPTSIQFLEHDILCIIFSVLDLFDLVRCSAVCKSWNIIIKGSKLLQALYLKQQKDNYVGISNIDSGSEKTLNMYFEELAMKHHRQSLVQASSVDIDQWKGHSLGVDQCRMKMGLLLTGVGDKVMRLWSLETYNCMEEYSIQDASPLIDFDFDESKIVGLVGTRICLWRRNGKMSTFPSREGTFMKGLCMRYFDPEAVVGCEDGTARVFDMYSRKCSKIIRMHPEPVTCLCLGDDQLILSGSSLGRIMVSGYSSDKWTATLRSTDSTGIKTLCFNPRSHLVFAGTTAGYTSCWDLRMMRQLWETRVSPNVIYSLQHLTNDKSALVAGGIDGVLRILDQDSGVVLSSYTVDHDTSSSSSRYAHGVIERRKGRKLPSDINIDQIPRSDRPSITCLAVGMKKVVTTHNSKYIRVWKFKK
ncbi:F-box/WD-40 repeat-containing protein At3g52030 isoform X1 [Jatropha curcas]|uniref:F-box/WD-40 repeat-containing protein At3g52030 isoform X1 n=1 Tax=Jatropha curcas TaxID=180498 RepID=UPI001894D3E5|nr:F-box/WD-40 repeat-containing protein At3g52030 isoform X1 [Jatropha curcas]